jgi:hypothetical protein
MTTLVVIAMSEAKKQSGIDLFYALFFRIASGYVVAMTKSIVRNTGKGVALCPTPTLKGHVLCSA